MTPFMQRSIRGLSVSLLIVLLVCGEAFNGMPGLWQYIDELAFSALAVVLISRLARGLCDSHVKRSLLIVLGISLLGFSGNLLFGIQKESTAVLLDWISTIKAPICFLAIYDLLTQQSTREIPETLVPLAKLLIVASAIFGTISLFFNIGMGGEARFGITSFVFIFKYQHSLSVVLMSGLLLISMIETSRARVVAYFLLVSYSLLLTTKGPSLIWIAVMALFLLVSNDKFKLKAWHVVLVMLFAVLLGGYQINNYFLNEDAPRFILFKYGFTTANSYLPTGAGFATYGSDAAYKFYSPIYVKYGFQGIWGMNSVEGMFLNDNYWPMVIGQFGYIGLVLFVVLYKNLFSYVQHGVVGKLSRCIAITNCIYIAIHSLGSAILTSSTGVLLFIVLAVASCMGKDFRNWEISDNG